MKESIIIAIWDRNDEVLTRTIVLDSKTKELKLNGKKPNKLKIPESCTDKTLLRRAKSIGSYGCKIIKAKGR